MRYLNSPLLPTPGIHLGAACEHGFHQRVVPLERGLVVDGHAIANAAQLERDDLGQHVVRDRVVRHHLHAAEERRLERLVERRAQLFGQRIGVRQFFGRLVQARLHDVRRPDVGRQDDDGVAEVDRAAFGVVHLALVEHLEEHLQHIGVGLLHFIQQHHAVRVAAHGLGQHTALAVANVARGRALEARHAMCLLVLAHVDGDELALATVEDVGQRQRRFGLAHT